MAAHMPSGSAQRRAQRGLTYLWVLLLIAALGAGAAAVADVWVTHAQREREAELLFVGEQIRRAIGAYFESTPGSARQYPRSLDDLVRDPRYPAVRRYLRRVYVDPITGSREWGIVKAPDGGIAGVFSTSTRPTLKKSGFRPEHRVFEDLPTYADWKFIYAAGNAETAGETQSEAPDESGASLLFDRPGPSGKSGQSGAARARKPDAERTASTAQDEKKGRGNGCGDAASADAASCEAIRASRGDEAAARCIASAARRQDACLAGDARRMPSLITQ